MTSSRRHLALAGAAVALAAAVPAGCGAGSDAAAFDDRAARICTDLDARLAALPAPDFDLDEVDLATAKGARQREALAAHGRQIDTYLTDALGELRSLEPPDDRRADWERWLHALDEQFSARAAVGKASARWVEALRDGDRAAIDTAEEALGEANRVADERAARADELARGLGVDACAQAF